MSSTNLSASRGDSFQQVPPWEMNADIKVQYVKRRAHLLQSPEDAVTPIEVDVPRTAPPLGASSRTPVYLPPAPKSTQHPPTFVVTPGYLPTPKTAQGVPTFVKTPAPCSDKSSQTSTVTTSASGSPESEKVVTSLPGTMSSRNAREREREPPYLRPRARDRRVSSKKPLPRKPTLARRWRAIFRDIFSHHPVDESQLQRIEDRHWTDEDY